MTTPPTMEEDNHMMKGEGSSSDTQSDAQSAPVTEATALLERLVTEAEAAFTRAPRALWSDRTYLAQKDAEKLRGLVASSELAGIKARLADSAALEWFIYEIFYANPIAFARQNLVIALQRHLLGLPIATEEEAQRAMLDGLSEAERAEWWRGENARRLAVRGVAA